MVAWTCWVPSSSARILVPVLVDYASRQGDLDLRERLPGDDAEKRVGNMLRLIAATREYQLA